MSAILSLVAVALLAVVVWRLVRAIVGDGLGHRPPPPSHHADPEVGSPQWWVDAWHSGLPRPRGRATLHSP